jgi:DNA-binding PadR family transcriptional regulator
VDDELLLLGLLSGSAMHGYQLNEIIDKRLSGLSSLKPSTAYSALDRLAGRGLVSVSYERVGRRPERKVYALTGSGRERFLELLRANLRAADLPAYAGNRGLLFLRALPADDVLSLLSERRTATEARLSPLERLRDGHPSRSTGRLVAEHAIVHLKAELAWLERVLVDGLDG